MTSMPQDDSVLRITCTAPGIRNHNGTPKPVATLADDGIWVFCRWSRELEFIPKDVCLRFWNGEQEPQQPASTGEDLATHW